MSGKIARGAQYASKVVRERPEEVQALKDGLKGATLRLGKQVARDAARALGNAVTAKLTKSKALHGTPASQLDPSKQDAKTLLEAGLSLELHRAWSDLSGEDRRALHLVSAARNDALEIPAIERGDGKALVQNELMTSLSRAWSELVPEQRRALYLQSVMQKEMGIAPNTQPPGAPSLDQLFPPGWAKLDSAARTDLVSQHLVQRANRATAAISALGLSPSAQTPSIDEQQALASRQDTVGYGQ